LWRKKEIRDLKKAYGGGYLGYTKIHNFGNISQFVELQELGYPEGLKFLSIKLKGYAIEIPENVTFSILAVLRWESSNGNYNSLTISDSIKITRGINTDLLAEKFISDIKEVLLEYSLRDEDLDLFIFILFLFL
jgi:hypothetical protein